MNITPDNITKLKPHEVFVFGSNLSGRHGKGAAKTAMLWGAEWGIGEGIQGQTYGIPTKDAAIRRTLDIYRIQIFVDDFYLYAKSKPTYDFLVTEIGCGLAGLKPEQVAPLFKDCANLKNVYLPKRFWNVIINTK